MLLPLSALQAGKKPDSMTRVKIASWNVNGLRSIARKGFFAWISACRADLVCIQEAKISEDNISSALSCPPGYSSFFSLAERKGYSGVGIYTKKKPERLVREMGVAKFDVEGRYVRADFAGFSLINLYCPNGKASPERLAYKLEFYEAFLAHARSLSKEGRKLVVCGDFNTAHTPIDLSRPKENAGVSGFLLTERDWMDRFVAAGYLDSFRHFCKEPGFYTWWSQRTAARRRNVGWRIDYFFVSDDLRDNLAGSEIHSDVMGSDHAPISLRLKF
jgi:exodeoxyribonuclease III